MVARKVLLALFRNAAFTHGLRLWLLVTAVFVAMSLVADPSGVALGDVPIVPGDPDHLKCYKIRDTNPKFKEHVDQFNQFGLEQCQLETRAEFLCVQTIKEFLDDPRGGPAVDRLCYRIRCDRAVGKSRLVDDQFGKRIVEVQEARFLCTPAIKLDP